MRMTRTMGVMVGICVLASVLASPVLAQIPRGTLTGTVTSNNEALPGVLVTATSPNLLGERTTTTGVNGGYKLPLPPGDYRITFQLDGFATATQSVGISAAQTMTSNVEMQLSEVTEEITITSNQETISETITSSSTYKADEVNKLPLNRSINASAFLAPGVHATGPGGNLSISGAMSFENLWMINGVVVNENVRGQSLPLYIEDAVQEQTVTTGGVSAQYGRFTGGVVNVLTKSGGNQFSGTFRTSFNNESWEAKTPLTELQDDTVNETFEGTFGGPFYRDKAWFFVAGRDRSLSEIGQTNAVNLLTYPVGDDETRAEGKLTLAFTSSHQIIGSYVDIDRERTNTTFGAGTNLDLGPVSPMRTDPQEIITANYSGILTPKLFIEAQYSERDFSIGVGSGGPRDLIQGTFLRERATGRRFHSAVFCGTCETEVRSNDNTLGKGSYFLTSQSAGTHDIVFGYDTFTDIRFSVNHQSGSDYQVWADDIIIDDNQVVYPVFSGTRTWVVWWPAVNLDIARPTDFVTNSFYVNDSWNLNEHWSFNLGVRYDENDGVDSGGALVADDSKVSPRVGLSYDLKGDGDLVLNASYGTYVAALANTRADSTSMGGSLAGFGSFYTGPGVNTDASCAAAGTCLTSAEALEVLFEWYFGTGAPTVVEGDLTQIPNLIFASLPGATSQILQSMKSPSTDEFLVGITKRLGNRGLLRADLIYRDWTDFYSNRTTLETGQVDTAAGPQDLTEVGNFGNDELSREYKGLHLQGRYRVTDKFTLSGNYTLSKTEGNINGETGGSGPVPQSPNDYPEYREARWNYPKGDLGTDQRHRVRLWGIYDVFNKRHHSLSASVLTNYFSGEPYSLAINVDPRPFVDNPGYIDPPDTVGYFLSGRGEFTFDDITRTDVSLVYTFKWNVAKRPVQVFIQPQILNIFKEEGIDGFDTNTLDATNSGGFQPFNPFTETPVQGVHWDFGPEFGTPTTEGSFQTPRIFRFSVGFRF